MYASNPLVWIAFLLYLSGTFLLAFLAHRRRGEGRFLEEFLVAGRGIGPWVLGLTWIATAASGGTFIGSPALAYSYGWVLLLWIASYMVVATLGFGVLGKRVAELGRRTGALTFPDLLRDRFESSAVGIFSGVAVIVLYTAYLVAQYIAGARLIEAVLGVPYLAGVIGFAVTVAIYTAYGGFRAVAWTDSFQAVVMLSGILMTAFFAVRKAGGMSAVFERLEQQSPELLSAPGPDQFLTVPTAISFFCIWALAAAGQPSLVTRFLASRDVKGLKRASVLVGLYILLLYPTIMTLGVVSRALIPELQAADHAIPAVIMLTVPPVLAGFVLAAPMAAIMSTISSFLLVCSSALVRDLYERNSSRELSERRAQILSHGATFAITGVALAFALRPPDFLQYIVVFSGTGLAATFLCPTVMAIYWPRMNRPGCMAGLLGGFLSFLLQYLLWGTKSFGGFDPFVWSLLFSLAAIVVVTLLTPPPPEPLTQRYFGRLSG